MATAVTGCVIVQQGPPGTTVRIAYQKKCEFCGHVEGSQTKVSVPTGETSKLRAAFTCVKCKRKNAIEILGR
jgi:hypothetical protein